MSLASALARGRQSHLTRMLDTFTIGVPSGGWTLVDGVDVETITPLFTTVGYFAAGARAITSSEVGGRTAVVAGAELRIPWNAAEVPSNAVATCTAIHATTPARMLNRSVRVDGSGGDGSQRTHYPLEVTEVLT
jgi:hypothetical protein